MTHRSIYSFLLCLAIVSCSVKEDRNDCPCRLVLLANEEPGNEQVTMAIFRHEIEYCRNTIPFQDLHSGYGTYVPKDMIGISALSGVEGNRIEDLCVFIPYGSESDRISVYGNVVDCRSDQAYDHIALRKNWCTLEICVKFQEKEDISDKTVKRLSETGTGEMPELTVNGNCCGFDLRTLEPIHGDFSFSPKPGGNERVYSIRLPRQDAESYSLSLAVRSRHNQERGTPGNLALDISPGNNETSAVTYDLAEVLENCGYDWMKPDLDDIRITLDKVGIRPEITITDWITGAETEIII